MVRNSALAGLSINRTGQPRRGLTLVEVVMSTLIVGVMTVAALSALGAATRSSESTGNRAVAQGLADDLMAEILATAYSDPNGSAVFGLETGEAAPRVNFDDVDDFNGWNRKPPQARDGTTLPDRADWRRRVIVERVEPSNPTQTTSGSTDLGAKRIRISVEYRDTVLADLFAVRTDTD
jgi:prepilin-type N-terminal cleavage/methylation domain-containing protein